MTARLSCLQAQNKKKEDTQVDLKKQKKLPREKHAFLRLSISKSWGFSMR